MTTVSAKTNGTAAEDSLPSSAEWFAAWLPKRTVVEMVPSPVSREESVQIPEPTIEPESLCDIEFVRAELEAVSQHLTDPSATGIRAAIPHLERAVAVFSDQIRPAISPVSDIPGGGVRIAIEALCAELAHATRLFENAYQLHSNWATQLGIYLDGTPRQLLYGRPEHSTLKAASSGDFAASSWEG
jgi:hypothetical protein